MGHKIKAGHWDKLINSLHRKMAHTYWVGAGRPMDQDRKRELNDWYSARREVAFSLADWMVENCLVSECYDIPEVFYDYLNDISVEKYKEMKAYYIWVEEGRQFKSKKEDRDEDYYRACEMLNKVKSGCKAHKESCLSFGLVNYLQDSEMTDKKKIERRKAHWSSMKHNDNRTDAHWDEAKGYVSKFYDGVRDVFEYSSKDECNEKFDELIGLLENAGNHHITNMFEFMLRCDFKTMQERLT